MDEHIDRRDAEAGDAIGDHVTGTMSRDDFIRRMTLLGFSATAIGGMLAGAGMADAATDRRFAGQTVSMIRAPLGHRIATSRLRARP